MEAALPSLPSGRLCTLLFRSRGCRQAEKVEECVEYVEKLQIEGRQMIMDIHAGLRYHTVNGIKISMKHDKHLYPRKKPRSLSYLV